MLGRLVRAHPRTWRASELYATSGLHSQTAVAAVDNIEQLRADPQFREAKANFERLKLITGVAEGAALCGYTEPTEVQRKAIRLILRGHNTVVCAETGTGKTAAYTLPLLHTVQLHRVKEVKWAQVHAHAQHGRGGESGEGVSVGSVDPNTTIAQKYAEFAERTRVASTHWQTDTANLRPGSLRQAYSPLALVVVPTKQLAEQVFNNIAEVAENLVGVVPGLVTSAGGPKPPANVDVVVGTPGSLLSVSSVPGLESERDWMLNVSFARMAVLDECDRLFSMGLFGDVRDILRRTALPKTARTEVGVQTVLVSATVTPKIERLLTRYAPRHQMVNLNTELLPPTTIKHVVYPVSHRRKKALLAYLLRRRRDRGKKALVFVRTQQRAQKLVRQLSEDGFTAAAIHGGVSPSKRRAALHAFELHAQEESENNTATDPHKPTTSGKVKSGECVQVIVATEAMARGVDVVGLPLVVNYDVPHVPEDYVHRVGRTGRLGNEGVAYTFMGVGDKEAVVGQRAVALDEEAYVENIERFLGDRVLERRKIPGKWKDDLATADPTEPASASQPTTTRRAYVTRKGTLTFDTPESERGSGASRYSQRQSRGRKARASTPTAVSRVRDLHAGRYEVVVREFEESRARKAGVRLPQTKTSAVKSRRERNAARASAQQRR